MPGKLVPILCKRHFDFTAVAGGASQDIVLVADIDTASYVYAGIFVRVHARNMTAGQSLDFSLYNTLPTEADHREFVETDGAGSPSALVTVTVTSASPAAAPGMQSDYTTRIGPFLKVVLSANQDSTPATFYAELSAELLLRENS